MSAVLQRCAAVAVALFLSGAAWAVQPGEMLDDPALEARAREISAGLRCPVCRNESIDESNATLSADLRLLVRERLVAGDTDQEVVDFVVSRYGEFVLLRPDASGANLVLWLAAPALLLIGLGIGWTTIRRRQPAKEEALSDAEKARLDEIMRS
ncbi:cytochrome c-type biogenesis protein [Flavimaricola marinus]|uniref:Cytochrome c-type biogenesis protein n=1 Tax=Flavimaricola marinus TaxID=1819565 RepID=A0A238LEG7_9RHOB|nr:cytochrome c-type biogenesis protein [Flavimaricola marinus]SMY07953.1 Cytochrome c-type biogenesis protein CcmH precursor [Flavimaricola marinus]